MRVKDLMTKTPFCCTDKDTIQHAASLMKSHDVGAIPVVTNCEEGKLLGIVTDRDICIKAVAADQGTCAFEVSEVMTKSPHACHADDSIEACEALMEQYQIRRIPVVDDKGICVGIVAQADIALRDSADSATGPAVRSYGRRGGPKIHAYCLPPADRRVAANRGIRERSRLARFQAGD